MIEQVTERGKYVIIEVADVFLAQDKVEEIPDETLEPEEYEAWKIIEDKATRQVIRQQVRKSKKEGYVYVLFFTVKEVEAKVKHPLPLGLNGMYLLMFYKKKPPLLKVQYGPKHKK